MHNEQVFTPSWMVNLMLDKLQYSGGGILQKHIIDNSCGKGAFLVEVVERYCESYIGVHGNADGLKSELETYIHGIEIEESCWCTTITNLNRVVSGYGIVDINWDIKQADALVIDDYKYKMDYVVGNPPYCNVHDFGDKYELIKKFSFAQGGMADLYLVFFELGINTLNNTGKLIYITPSSWTTSIAAKPFRDFLINTNKLDSVITLGHTRVFTKATTFSIITEIDNDKDNNSVTLYNYNPSEVNYDYIASRPLSLFTVGDTFHFTDDTETVKLLREIEKGDYPTRVMVKNGFATLNDKLFVIDEELCEGNPLLSAEEVIPAIKASTGETKYMVFPYDKENNNKPLGFEELSEITRNYLLRRARQLHLEEKGKMNGEWWLYGRTQALRDYGKSHRYSMNNLIRSSEDVKIEPLFSCYGVYSGLYIIYDDDFELEYEEYEWMSLLHSIEFEKYVKVLGKYKNGGFYTFSSKELQDYINYKLNLIHGKFLH